MFEIYISNQMTYYMKKFFLLAALSAAVLWTACSRTKGAYVDLRTGESIEIEKDPVTGEWLNADTKEPVYIYVDTRNNDTIYGLTGATINGHVVKEKDVYWFDEDLDKEYKVKNEDGDYKLKIGDDYKVKVEDDGDMKIKKGNKKIKIDDGEKKVKYDD